MQYPLYVKAIKNEEQQEVEVIEAALRRVCAKYHFVKATVSYGDANGQLVAAVKGKTANSPEWRTVLCLLTTNTNPA